jgi:hypothetical protein
MGTAAATPTIDGGNADIESLDGHMAFLFDKINFLMDSGILEGAAGLSKW